jgi:hypothetical protein
VTLRVFQLNASARDFQHHAVQVIGGDVAGGGAVGCGGYFKACFCYAHGRTSQGCVTVKWGSAANTSGISHAKILFE